MKNRKKIEKEFSFDSLIEEAFLLKTEKRNLDQRLKEIIALLSSSVEFERNKNTAYIPCSKHYTAKIIKRENIKWDTAFLLKAKEFMGENEFNKYFRHEYLHISRQAIENLQNSMPKIISQTLQKAKQHSLSYSLIINKD